MRIKYVVGAVPRREDSTVKSANKICGMARIGDGAQANLHRSNGMSVGYARIWTAAINVNLRMRPTSKGSVVTNRATVLRPQ
jgi:hypothetical protein